MGTKASSHLILGTRFLHFLLLVAFKRLKRLFFYMQIIHTNYISSKLQRHTECGQKHPFGLKETEVNFSEPSHSKHSVNQGRCRTHVMSVSHSVNINNNG